MLKLSAEDANKTVDQSTLLDPVILRLVQAAMAIGFESFTTPTSEFDEHRIEWRTRRWVVMKKDLPTCFMVAYREDNAHFEVVGPEIAIKGPKG